MVEYNKLNIKLSDSQLNKVKAVVNPNKAGLFEGIFFLWDRGGGWGVNLNPALHILRRTYLIHNYTINTLHNC